MQVVSIYLQLGNREVGIDVKAYMMVQPYPLAIPPPGQLVAYTIKVSAFKFPPQQLTIPILQKFPPGGKTVHIISMVKLVTNLRAEGQEVVAPTSVTPEVGIG